MDSGERGMNPVAMPSETVKETLIKTMYAILSKINAISGSFCDPKSPLNFLSHNNPCFLCNIATTNFLVSHTSEIRFHDVIDVIDRTVRVRTFT